MQNMGRRVQISYSCCKHILTLRIIDKPSWDKPGDITQSRRSVSGTRENKKACGDAEATAREGGDEAAKEA